MHDGAALDVLVEMVDGHHHVHAREHLAKDGVAAVEVRRGRDDDREVAAVRVARGKSERDVPKVEVKRLFSARRGARPWEISRADFC